MADLPVISNDAQPVIIVDGTTTANILKIDADGAALISPNSSDTATVTSVASSVTNVVLLASNDNRKGFLLYNDGTANQFIKFGVTATTSSYTIKLGPNSLYEASGPVYSGEIDVISSNTNGAIRVTELI